MSKFCMMAKQVVARVTDEESEPAVKSASIEDPNRTHEEEHTFENLSLDQDTMNKALNTSKPFVQKKSNESESINGVSRSNYTTLQPYALATEKRAAVFNRALAEVAASNGDKPATKCNKQSSKAQGITNLTSRKSPQHDDTKYPDDDDSCCATTATTPVRAKGSKFTVAIAPTFRCSERAEKRKEFYSKLEERHQAMEAERLQNEARLREEQEAALKELRKTMVFKANPVPSFYQEGPPRKVELKKVPLTRAKSPKLSRRKSYADAETSSNPDGVCTRLRRHSLGGSNDSTNKLQSSPKIGNATKGRESNPFKESSKYVANGPSNQETTSRLTAQT